MPAKESSATVGDGGLARLDRPSCQMALDVPRELVDRTIPAFWLLAQRLYYDGIEITAQSAPQFSRLHTALGAHRLQSNCRSLIAVARHVFFRFVNDNARFFGLSFANQPLHFQKRLGRAKRPMAGQQFKKQYP